MMLQYNTDACSYGRFLAQTIPGRLVGYNDRFVACLILSLIITYNGHNLTDLQSNAHIVSDYKQGDLPIQRQQ